MYSVVMMMVLSSSPETAAFGHHGGCNGCSGYSCSGYSAGCNGCGGGCWGGGHRHHHNSCSGCGGGCYGCGGGCLGGHRHHRHNGGCCGCMGYAADCGCNGGMMSCYGGGGYGGCWGGAPMMAPMGAPMMNNQGNPGARPEGAPAPNPGNAAPAPHGAMIPAAGNIVVALPADAVVTFDGVATNSASDLRRYATPVLAPGTVATYTLGAEIVRDGQKLTVTRVVSVRAGETTEVNLGADMFATSVVRN